MADSNWFIERFLFWVPLLLSLTVHEWAHAASAKLLGEDTAQRMGRLTLNPMKHIDPIGTLILPLLGIPFGWAKPVPINPTRFRFNVSMDTGLLLTAAAGPASNLVLALLAVGALGISARLGPGLPPELLSMIETFTVLNVLLAFFNLLPIPPLDGSRIVDSFIPHSLRPAWDVLAEHSGIALVVLIFLPRLSGVDLFAVPHDWAMRLLDLAKG
jgi:Zn-dependent protease